jgi:hypothetical protein
MKRIFLLPILIVFVGINAWSQDPVATEEQTVQNLNTQYNKLKQNAETYGEFKVFRESDLDNFWLTVDDSLSVVRGNLNEKNTQIENQVVEIDKLNTEAKDNEERFQQNEYAATHIKFIGIDFTKSTFKITMSVLVIGLTLLMVIGSIQYSHNKRNAIQNARECKKVESEYEELRRKSLEKQIQLKRELQTERNLIEEFRNKSTVTKKISA